MPEEVRAAKRINQEGERIIEKAQEEAERIVDEIVDIVEDRLESLAAYSDPGYAEQGQLTVTYLTDAHRAAAKQIVETMKGCGFDEVKVDAVGNVVGVYKAGQPGAKTLMTGSHYDTVRNGGKYDGRLGILLPIAVAGGIVLSRGGECVQRGGQDRGRDGKRTHGGLPGRWSRAV